MIKQEILREMLISGAGRVVDNEQYLCKLDSVVGDGDHGITAARGFSKAGQLLKETQFKNIGELMTGVGKALSDSMGGAIGPIMGSIFLGAGNFAADRTELTEAEFGAMMRAGCENVKKLGGAKPGDRTLVDALEPAVHILEEGGEFKATMIKAADAAMAGATSTKDMIARKGRARFMGEKSRGYQDAGATTFAILIRAMAEAV